VVDSITPYSDLEVEHWSGCHRILVIGLLVLDLLRVVTVPLCATSNSSAKERVYGYGFRRLTAGQWRAGPHRKEWKEREL
jgi:hypothetical protein